MSEHNPFDDLADTTDDHDSESTPRQDTQSNESTDINTIDGSSEIQAQDELDGPSLSNSSPPFPYSEADQNQMYVQTKLWEDLEDLQFDAELHLRREYGIRNVEQRELDTAVTQLLINRVTALQIAKKVVEMRGFDPEDSST